MELLAVLGPGRPAVAAATTGGTRLAAVASRRLRLMRLVIRTAMLLWKSWGNIALNNVTLHILWTTRNTLASGQTHIK